MNKYLGDFTIVHKELGVSKDGAPYIKMKVNGIHGDEVAYCYYNLEEYMALLDKSEIVSIDGFRMGVENKGFISVRNIRMNINELYKHYSSRYFEITKHIVEENCREFFIHMTDESELISSFMTVPASLKDHHAYICGLMAHTVEAMELGLGIYEGYDFKGKVDKSALIFGLFLHDIGKTLCYEVDGFELIMTERCKKVGHVSLGYELLLRKSYSYGNLPLDLRDKLGNIILSHHVDSKVKPMSIEAEIIRNIDNLSAGLGKMEVYYG